MLHLLPNSTVAYFLLVFSVINVQERVRELRLQLKNGVDDPLKAKELRDELDLLYLKHQPKKRLTVSSLGHVPVVAMARAPCIDFA